MAVTETKNPSSLKVKFDYGLNDDGKIIVRTRTYSNVKAGANVQDIFDVTNALIDIHFSIRFSFIVYRFILNRTSL